MPRTGLAATLLALVLAGCTLLPVAQSPDPTSSAPTINPPSAPPGAGPTIGVTPSPTQHSTSSPAPDPTPESTPTLAPQLSPDVSLAPWSGELRWRQLDGDRGLGEVLYAEDLVAGHDALVAFGELGQSEWDEEWVFWSSTNGLDWTRSFPPGDRQWGSLIYGLAVVGDQFIAFGDRSVPGTSYGEPAVFQSADGARWQYAERMTDAFDEIQIAQSDSTFVGLGFDGDLIVSTDGGESWTPGGSLDVEDQARRLVFDGQRFVVLMQGSADDQYRSAGPVSAWASSDGVEWISLGEVFGGAHEWPVIDVVAIDGVIAVLLADPEGGIYSNGRRVWHSSGDGAWQLAPLSPRGASRVFPTAAGFVAIGQCIWDGEAEEFEGFDDYGVTWTSADGASWSYVPGAKHGRLIQAVAEYHGQLVGIGFDFDRYMADKPAGAVWVADMPALGDRWADSGRDAPNEVCQHR